MVTMIRGSLVRNGIEVAPPQVTIMREELVPGEPGFLGSRLSETESCRGRFLMSMSRPAPSRLP
jgi:hypothetical protein